jgi:hypothetical protein
VSRQHDPKLRRIVIANAVLRRQELASIAKRKSAAQEAAIGSGLEE